MKGDSASRIGAATPSGMHGMQTHNDDSPVFV